MCVEKNPHINLTILSHEPSSLVDDMLYFDKNQKLRALSYTCQWHKR